MNEIKFGAHTVKIKPNWKASFYSVWIFGMLSHAYRFFNYLPTWDSMFNVRGTGVTFQSGRCFLGFFGKLSTEFDVPWLNGAISLFCISIVAVLLAEIFEIRSNGLCVLMGALLVTFPTVTSSFAYMYTADAYMMAFLMAVAGVYVTWRYKYGVIAGSVLVGLSIGTYQAYVATAAMVILLLVIRDLVIKRKSFKEMFLADYQYGVLLVGGGVFYKVVSGILNSIYHVTLNGYQGIDKVGIMNLAQYIAACRKTVKSLLLMWCLHDGLFHTNKYGLVHAAVIGGILLGTVLLVIKNKTYKNILGLLVTVVGIAALPFVAFLVNFASPDVGYHTLMEMGVCFIYLLLVIYLEHGNWKNKAEKCLKFIGVLALSFLCYFNVLLANEAYHNMQYSFEKSYSTCADILHRIENLDGYERPGTVVFMGTYHAYSPTIEELNPSIMGVSQDVFLDSGFHYISMWNYCFGRSFGLGNGAQADIVRDTEEYRVMPVYPANGSVAYVGDYIVVKFEE